MNNPSRFQDRVGWQLVLGFLVFGGMTLVLGEISDDVLKGEPLTNADVRFSNWLHRTKSARLITTFWIITHLGSTLAVISITTVVGIYLMRRRQHYWLTAFWLSVFGGMLLNRFLKLAFQRARPEFDDPVFSFTGYSFPSGHTMTATVLYGALAAFLFTRTKTWQGRVLLFLVASLTVGLVGFSRIYLGAHYLSDVLAAIAEGLAWLSLCFTAVYYFWRERNRVASRQAKKG